MTKYKKNVAQSILLPNDFLPKLISEYKKLFSYIFRFFNIIILFTCIDIVIFI